jgi:DNA-binding response OmpR family regulator
MSRILIAEDEARLASFLQKGFRASGFATAVAGDGETAAAMARDESFDLMILDLGLPRRDGSLVLRDLRSTGQRLPVIVLTARDEIDDKLAAFAGGADDYLTKPFRFEELLARVKARLRDEGTPEETVIRVGRVVLDLRERRVKVRNRPVELTAREFALLEVLARHGGQVLAREQLLSHVWGYDYDPCSNVVDVYVGYLRRKLGPDVIETVRGVGYRLVT